MNPVLRNALFLRFILTPLLFLTKNNIVLTIIMLVFLDIVDCNPIILKLFTNEYKGQGCSYDENYQLLDKSIDIFQYIFAIILLQNILPKNIFNISLAFLLYRIIGMIIYLLNKNNKIFIIFIDFIKEYLTLFILFGEPSSYILFGSIVLKIIYEYLMHKQHIFLDLYKIIFE